MISPIQDNSYDNWKDIAGLLYRVLYAHAIMEKKDMQAVIAVALTTYEEKLDAENEDQ